MTSNDTQQQISVELFNSKFDNLITQIQLGNEKLRNDLNSKIDSGISGLRSEFQTSFSELHNEIRVVDTNVKVNSAKIEMLEHTFYWGFALMTLIIAIVAVFVPYLLHERKDKNQEASIQPALTEEKVHEMIQSALSKIGHVKRGEAS